MTETSRDDSSYFIATMRTTLVRPARPILLALATLVFDLVLAHSAAACGASGPDGIAYCSLSERPEASRSGWALGLSGLYTSTNIHFSHGIRGDERREEALLTIVHSPSENLTLQLGVGAMLGGTLDMPNGQHDFSPGPAALAGAAWRVVNREAFVILSSALSFSENRTRFLAEPSQPYTAFDLRLGAVFGVTIFNALSPYVPLRVFGGPIFWHYAGESVTGTDAYHYQVGLGLALHLPLRFNLFAEGVPLGEKALAGGVAWELP